MCPQARKALADRQKDLEVKTQQLEIKLSNKTEEDIKKARRKSTQAGQKPDQPENLEVLKPRGPPVTSWGALTQLDEPFTRILLHYKTNIIQQTKIILPQYLSELYKVLKKITQ